MPPSTQPRTTRVAMLESSSPPRSSLRPQAAGMEVTPPRAKSRPPRTTPKRWANSGATTVSPQQQLRHHQVVTPPPPPPPTSSDASVGAPSSVLIGPASPLARELSDLSGSYAGRTAASVASGASTAQHHLRSNGRYRDGDERESGPGPLAWHQARILSAREPAHPQPQSTDCGDSVTAARRSTTRSNGMAGCGGGRGPSANASKSAAAAAAPFTTTLVVHNTAVEVIEHGFDDEFGQPHRRIPLVVLLMDPSRKLYELAQLWVDPEGDSVRDVLRAIQLHLHDQPRWRQDYDGLFHARNHTFSQLIHVLDVRKYDCRPHEIWVAKPWSMSAKATVTHAGTLLRTLKDRGIVQQQSSSGRQGESVLVLSKEARKRVYVPDGILRHRHACQYLSFCPPFEPLNHHHRVTSKTPLLRVDVLGADTEDGCSQLSDSHCLSLGSVAAGAGAGDCEALLRRRPSSSSPRHPRAVNASSSRPRSSESSAASTTRPLQPPSRAKNPPASRHYEPPSKARRHSNNNGQGNGGNGNGGGLVQALGALKCGSCKRDGSVDDDRFDSSASVGPTWRAAWDEASTMTATMAASKPFSAGAGAATSSASVAPSVASESAPLLRAGRAATTVGWRYEI